MPESQGLKVIVEKIMNGEKNSITPILQVPRIDQNGQNWPQFKKKKQFFNNDAI